MTRNQNTHMLAGVSERARHGSSLEDATEVAADAADIGGDGHNWSHTLLATAIGAGGAIVAGVGIFAVKEYVLPKKRAAMTEEQWEALIAMAPVVQKGIEQANKPKLEPEA